MIYPLVRELAYDGFSVRLTCRVLKFSPHGYYRWARRPISHRDYENAYLTNALVDAHRKDPAFGYRFLADELERKEMATGEQRVWRLCSQAGLWASFVKKPHSSKKPGPPVHDDLVLRNFSANKANQLWFTDITEHPTKSGKLYMCSLEDAFSGRIVGYSMKWQSQEELRAAIVYWIEGTYHRRRRKRSLGKMTPVEYEVVAEVLDKELLVA